MTNPSLSLPVSPDSGITDSSTNGSISEPYGTGNAGCNGFWRQAALIVPSALLLLYLGFLARRHVKKLSHRKSYVMIAYYALLWTSAISNFAWSLVQGWQCSPGSAVGWNLLSLFTESGMLFLEISIVAFLLQDDYASGLESLAHTFLPSGSFVAADILVQAIFTFGFGIPLFIINTASGGTDWEKWGFSFLHALIVTAIYCYILFVHYSKWRDKLPPRPSFYNYAVVMFVFSVAELLASGLAGVGFSFGVWLYNFGVICRHALYLPYLYITFLADFFQEEDWLLDNAYYAEMKDAGFFDTDWE